MKCWTCDACREKYTCSCPDYEDREYLCKHIHAVCLFISGYTNQPIQNGANGAAANAPRRDTRDAETQVVLATPFDPIPGSLRQGDPLPAPSVQTSNDALSSDSERNTLERPGEVRLDLKSRILADALDVSRLLLVKYDQLNEPELRRVRVLLRELRHIVRDGPIEPGFYHERE